MSVFVTTNEVATDRLELVLEAMDGAEARWSKVYDAPLFLSMDAESLGLLEQVPNPPSGSPKFRLKHSGKVRLEQLARMRFTEAQGSASRRD